MVSPLTVAGTALPQLSMHSPVGPLTVSEEEGNIVALDWGWGRDQTGTPVLREARRQLDAFFDGDLCEFNLPLAPAGTPYRQRVWEALLRIPFGRTVSYAELAAAVGGSARSIGQANRCNPIPIVIPCHRVVGRTGIGGYSGGEGLEVKRHLLALEREHAGLPLDAPPPQTSLL